jgi:hypothetical protein
MPHIDYFRISNVGTIRKVLQGLMIVNTWILPMLYRDRLDRVQRKVSGNTSARWMIGMSFTHIDVRAKTLIN